MSKCDFNKVASNFTEVTLRHGCSPVNLLHISEHLFLRIPLEAASGHIVECRLLIIYFF